MNEAPSLKSILQAAKARDEEAGRLGDRAARIRLRSTEIQALYNSFQEWLEPAIREGIVELRRQSLYHIDKQLGALSEESLTLTVGALEVWVVPRTGSIAGAIARVDMTSNELSLPVILLPDRGWHFLVRDTVTRTEPVTEASFAEAMKELLSA